MSEEGTTYIFGRAELQQLWEWDSCLITSLKGLQDWLIREEVIGSLKQKDGRAFFPAAGAVFHRKGP